MCFAEIKAWPLFELGLQMLFWVKFILWVKLRELVKSENYFSYKDSGSGWSCINFCNYKFMHCFLVKQGLLMNIWLFLFQLWAEQEMFLSSNSHVEWLIWKYVVIWQRWTYLFLLGIRDKLYYFTSLEQQSCLSLPGVKTLFREFYTPNHLIQ